MTLVAADTALLLRYYELFNQRRLHEASTLVADECEFEHRPTRERTIGPRGYLAFAEEWLHAMPDMAVTVVSVTPLETGAYRVQVSVNGHANHPMTISAGVQAGGDGQLISVTATQEIRISAGRLITARTHFEPSS